MDDVLKSECSAVLLLVYHYKYERIHHVDIPIGDVTLRNPQKSYGNFCSVVSNSVSTKFSQKLTKSTPRIIALNCYLSHALSFFNIQIRLKFFYLVFEIAWQSH